MRVFDNLPATKPLNDERAGRTGTRRVAFAASMGPKRILSRFHPTSSKQSITSISLPPKSLLTKKLALNSSVSSTISRLPPAERRGLDEAASRISLPFPNQHPSSPFPAMAKVRLNAPLHPVQLGQKKKQKLTARPPRLACSPEIFQEGQLSPFLPSLPLSVSKLTSSSLGLVRFYSSPELVN